MPLKNAGKYLAECLESIQKQTISDWELVIVNDHSTDNSIPVVLSFQRNDPRIRLIPNSGNGIIPALQTAFQECTGQYLTRIDADDTMPISGVDIN